MSDILILLLVLFFVVFTVRFAWYAGRLVALKLFNK